MDVQQTMTNDECSPHHMTERYIALLYIVCSFKLDDRTNRYALQISIVGFRYTGFYPIYCNMLGVLERYPTKHLF